MESKVFIMNHKTKGFYTERSWIEWTKRNKLFFSNILLKSSSQVNGQSSNEPSTISCVKINMNGEGGGQKDSLHNKEILWQENQFDNPKSY